MSKQTCASIIVTCIDFRFQDYIQKWIADNLPAKSFDRVAFAGGVYSLPIVLDEIKISKRLHDIHHVYLMNHEDCGAYGEEGTYTRHVQDLKTAADRVKQLFSDVEVKSFLIHLDGQFEEII